MRRRRVLGALSALPAAAALRPALAAGVPLRVGTLPIDPCGQALYASDHGFFADHGLAVALTIMTNAAAVVAAVAGRALDVGFASIPGLALAHQHGIPVQLFAPAAIYRGGTGNTILMCAANAPLRTGAQLDGKTVAVTGLHDLTQFETEHWIDATGGKSATVQFVEMPYSEMGAALEQGQVQAAAMVEPFVTATKSKHQARVLANLSAQMGGPYLVGGWIARTDWVAANGATAQRCAAALLQAGAWANTDPAASAKILEHYSKLPPKVAARMTRARYDTSPHIDPETVQRALDLMVSFGALKPVSASALIYQGAS